MLEKNEKWCRFKVWWNTFENVTCQTCRAVAIYALMFQKEDKDDIIDVVDEGRRPSSSAQAITVIRFRCPMCSKKYKTRMALKKHMEHNAECNVAKKPAPTSQKDALPQCFKCTLPFRNQELLLKHMLTHKSQPPKKKGGLRGHIRHQMSTNRIKMASYCPAKTASGNSNTWTSGPRTSRGAADSGDSDEEASVKSACRKCSRSRKCSCSLKKLPPEIEVHIKKDIHNEREKERRSEIRKEFIFLADLLGMDNKFSPKHSILSNARDEIVNLEKESTKLDRTLNDLKDMNVRLVSRQYQLRNSRW